MNKIRTFIAIHIEPSMAILTLIDNCKKNFESDKFKWVQPEDLHLTLKFLGNTSLSQIELVSSQV